MRVRTAQQQFSRKGTKAVTHSNLRLVRRNAVLRHCFQSQHLAHVEHVLLLMHEDMHHEYSEHESHATKVQTFCEKDKFLTKKFVADFFVKCVIE